MRPCIIVIDYTYIDMKELNEEYLLKQGFQRLQDSVFDDINLRYYVRNGFCLFSNEQEGNDSLLIGFAGMTNGKYKVVTHKWIHFIEELKPYLKLFPA